MGCYPFPLPEGPNDDVSKAHRRTTLQQRDTSYVGFFTITTWLHPQLRRRSHLLQDNGATQGRCTKRSWNQPELPRSELRRPRLLWLKAGSTHRPLTLGLPEPYVPVESFALVDCSSNMWPKAMSGNSQYIYIPISISIFTFMIIYVCIIYIIFVSLVTTFKCCALLILWYMCTEHGAYDCVQKFSSSIMSIRSARPKA